MQLGKFFSHRMESYKELTCEFLASMKHHEFDELDRAELDQGWGYITFLAKGEKKMVTFRQLEILFGFTYGEGPRLPRSEVLCLDMSTRLLQTPSLQGKPLEQSMREK
ncbi:unnamed protein product [Microthlaspi erraticum]|uniref:Arabidopsis retrotransposon Orf1 C-terminal domain-containing protein n=1 Tax=Microthlaspi erraticum TaxID=1685480 RepID=A0A6D2I2T3_9BRAS|nr:unnamed protein product [Microthlaspi erraticum]